MTKDHFLPSFDQEGFSLKSLTCPASQEVAAESCSDRQLGFHLLFSKSVSVSLRSNRGLLTGLSSKKEMQTHAW